MPSRRTRVEINEELLLEAQRILQTQTVEDTVERALWEIVRANARREEVRALSRMEGMDLDDPTIVSKAWRCSTR